jgi:hypothetical protein
MCTDRLLQGEGSLEFHAVAFLAAELATKSFELLPARLLVTDRTIAIGDILKMATEILDFALHQTGTSSLRS